MASSALSSARALAGRGASLLILDADGGSSTLQRLTTGEVVGGSSGAAAQTVVAFDANAGLLVLSGAAGVTRLDLPSMVLGVASRTTVLVVPMALLAPRPTSAVGEETSRVVAGGSQTGAMEVAAVKPSGNPSGDQEPHSMTKKNAGNEAKVHLTWVMLSILVCSILCCQ
jgi:hypothetical protein